MFDKKFNKYAKQVKGFDNLFPLKNAIRYEINEKGKATKPAEAVNDWFFVSSTTKAKTPVTFKGLLVKSPTLAEKQGFLMQIMTVEKNIQKAKDIYENWDWLEFVLYKNSLNSVSIIS